MKRSLSLIFRDTAPSVGFQEHIAKNHTNDVVGHNRYAGILSFNDESWAEWQKQADGTICIWAYDKRSGMPFKTNPRVIKTAE